MLNASAISQDQLMENSLNFREKTLEKADHLVIDPSLWMDPDADAFFDFLSEAAPALQKEKYPDQDDSYVIIPHSCLVEIVKHAENPTGNVPEEKISRGKIAIARFERLQRLGVVVPIEDNSLGFFGDSALLSMAIGVNSRKTLLFLVMDQSLGRDLLKMKQLESINNVRHQVFSVDQNGFFTRIREKRSEPILSQKLFSVPNTSAISRPRGFGSISLYSCTGNPSEQPDCALDAAGELDEGDELFCVDGKKVVLGVEISGGSESQIFRISGNDKYIVKVFGHPTVHKQAKVEMLCARDFELDGAVLPEEACYTANGVFKGYIMRYVADSVSLSTLFFGEARKKFVARWDRSHFVRLGLSLARAYRRLHVKGMLLSDISDANVRVMLDAEGNADPDRIAIIDIDSAQFGHRDGPIYSADGMTRIYAAPEILQAGWKKGELRSYAGELFSISVLVTRCLLCGLHPWRAIHVASDDPDFEESDAIMAGTFPYGAQKAHKSWEVKAIGLGSYLWSNMPVDTKCFIRTAMTCPAEQRPKLDQLINACERYLEWILKPGTKERFPQAREIAPDALKPFMTHCVHCNRAFDVANSRSWTSRAKDSQTDEFLCPDCAAEVIGKCEVCGKATLTRGEAFVGKRSHRLCSDCYARGRDLATRMGRDYGSAKNTSAPSKVPEAREFMSENEKLDNLVRELSRLLGS